MIRIIATLAALAASLIATPTAVTASESRNLDSIFVCRPQGLVLAGEPCRLHGTALVFEVDAHRHRACLATERASICGNVALVHHGTLDNAAVAFEAHRAKDGVWRLARVEPSPPDRNRGPTVVADAVRTRALSLYIGEEPTEQELSLIFEDPEREPLRYDASVSNNVVDVDIVNGKLAIRALRRGSAEVTVTAIDSGGSAVTWRFTVAVEPEANVPGLPVWAVYPIQEALNGTGDATGDSRLAAASWNVVDDLRTAVVQANVVRTLATNGHRHGGCMAELDLSLADTGLHCPGGWIAFSCDGTYAARGRAISMFRVAQLAFGLGRPVSVSVTDRRKHNGHCVADRVDVFNR